MGNEIIVSITCVAYNHEQYIADAIEGFLMQKTDFQYEVLIHDDASTDRTSEIIRKYELKYPNIIKPIYQIENQYSKGIKVDLFNMARAKGKYIAICEGDDYWIDQHKLQKQVNYMDHHPECSLCVHAVYMVKPDKSDLKRHLRPNIGNRIYTVEDIISGGGGFFGTNSILYRAVFKDNKPNFCGAYSFGDYPLVIYLALQGSVYYMDEFMSAYRYGVSGSWTSRTCSNAEGIVKVNNEVIDMFDEINNYTRYRYEYIINEVKKRHRFQSLLLLGKYQELKRGEFKEVYISLGTIEKGKLFIKQYFPSILKGLIKVKRGFSS